MRSLLAALVIGLVLSLAGVFAVQWSVVRLNFDEVMRDYIAGELASDGDELRSAMSFLSSGQLTIALSHYDPPFLTPHSGRYYQILVDGVAALRSPSLADLDLGVRPAAPGSRTLKDVAGPNGQALLLSTTGHEIEGRAVTIAVAADLMRVRAEFGRLMSRYTHVSLALFSLLVVLQVGIVRFALAPLRRVTEDVRRLEHGEIVQLGERVPSEVLPLVREVNSLLTLLARRLQRSRNSLGNLAHALKAPLTVLTHIANDEHVMHAPVLARQMGDQLRILRSRIDAELRRARVAGSRAPGLPLPLAAEIDTLVATLRKLYRDRTLEIDCRIAEDARFRGDREDLLELCGNLLDNACKWAKSKVRITASDGSGLKFTVEDDGPGCSAQALGQISQRGVRLDESVEGHGLGLSIVRGIIEAYGGEIEFGRSSALGGFQAVVTFPGD